MSHDAMDWVWTVRGLSPTEQHVLLALADHHNRRTSRCDPSIPRLAERTRISERTIRRALDELEAKKVIEVASQPGRRSSYRLAFDDPGTTTPVTTTPVTTTPVMVTPVMVPADPGHGDPNPGHGDHRTRKNQEVEPSASRVPSPPEVGRQDQLSMLPAPTPVPASEPAGPRAELFGSGLATLMRITGKRDKTARTLLGRLRKEAGNDALVLEALRRAEEAELADPEAWLMAAVRPRQRASMSRTQPVSEEVEGWLVRPVISRVLEELDVGDLRFPELPQVVVSLLGEKHHPDAIYAAARHIARRGLESMEGAGLLASIVRRRAIGRMEGEAA